MKARDVLVQINELLLSTDKTDMDVLLAIDDLVSEFFEISPADEEED